MELPEHLVEQFRAVAQERVGRIEAAWAQVLVAVDDDASSQLHREVHTLKGESRMLGFTDIHLVCHKLEDLLEVARARGYAVDDDFDLTVNMALRFMTMLARKKVGSHLGGIDLPGFIRQIDQTLSESRPEVARTRSGTILPVNRISGAPRVPTALREKLAPIALDMFIEYGSALGARRDRLRGSWFALREMIGMQRAIVGPAQLVKLKSNATALARELGKQVEVSFALPSVEVTAEVLAAIDVAALHLARNAVDHGIEMPAERLAVSKPASGKISLRGGIRGDHLIVELEDDGRGIQWERVRARGVELGISRATVDSLDHERLIELLCQPGFSTRAEATDISGRGVGLDAVRAAVHELGGTLSATSREGAGTIWKVSIPVPQLTVHGHVIRPSGCGFPVLVEARWVPSAYRPGDRVIDLAAELGLGLGTGDLLAFQRGDERIAFPCERAATVGQGRRLVATPPQSVGEIVVLDSLEALLIRVERL
ncbi:MAG: Hpt domain-containing protein [Kofleriaceae bacterium]|nr:Hpt domain-containing protein [Kofleriaceae bacterium]